jgi:hypothetical protein
VDGPWAFVSAIVASLHTVRPRSSRIVQPDDQPYNRLYSPRGPTDAFQSSRINCSHFSLFAIPRACQRYCRSASVWDGCMVSQKILATTRGLHSRVTSDHDKAPNQAFSLSSVANYPIIDLRIFNLLHIGPQWPRTFIAGPGYTGIGIVRRINHFEHGFRKSILRPHSMIPKHCRNFPACSLV